MTAVIFYLGYNASTRAALFRLILTLPYCTIQWSTTHNLYYFIFLTLLQYTCTVSMSRGVCYLTYS